MLLPRLRARLDRDRLVLIATLACAGTLVALALVRDIWLRGVALPVNGFAWIGVLSSLQIAAQTSVPTWVRARALSLYIVVFSLGMATVGLVWSAVAQAWSARASLLSATVACVIAALLATRFRLAASEALDLAPSTHWPQPHVNDTVTHVRGPARVTIKYRIGAADRDAFIVTIRTLGRTRRRDGALSWDVLEDAARPGVWLETFVVASWLEHLSQHERVMREEQALQTTLRTISHCDNDPLVRHFVGGAPGAPRPAHINDHAAPTD